MPELEEGHLLGRYRIERFLAEGGMGRVYRAFDTILGRRVALKVLATDEEPGSPATARLVRGARAAAAFSHPNVCAVFDAGEVDGQPFIAMELVEGASLRALIATTEVDVAERLRWLFDLAGALAATHRAHVVHRDIKPDNVMIDADGRVRLLDFGVATWEDGSPTEPGAAGAAGPAFRTQAGRVVGTRGYMAPEQADGGPVDARTDQFAWGVLAYEALSGRHPFPADHELRTPALVSTWSPALPFGVAAIVAKAMAFDPAQRFTSMTELIGQLAPLVPAAPASDAATTEPRRRGRALARWAAPLVAVLAGAGVLVSVRHAAPPPSAPVLAISHPRRVTFGAGCEQFPSFTPDGRAVVYSGNDPAGNTRLYRVELDRPGPPRLVVADDQDGWDLAPAVSPAGDRVAFLHKDRDRSSTMVAPLDGSAPPRPFGTISMYPRWSYDGRAIWAGNYGELARYDADTGNLVHSRALPAGLYASSMIERADGSIVAHVNHGDPGAPTGLALFAADGRLRWQLAVRLEDALALSPDGRHVLASRQTFGGAAELVAIPLDGAPVLSLAETGVVARSGLAISAGGARLAWSTCRAVPRISAVAPAGRFEPVMAGEEADALALAAIPGSHDLAVVSERTGTFQLWVMDPTGRRAPRRIATGDRPVRDVAISPDGARFAVVLEGAGLGVGVLQGDPAFRTLTDDASDRAPAFRRGGDEVMFTRRLADDTAQVMQAPWRGGPARAILEPSSHDATVSPTDDRIVYLAGAPAELPTLADPAGTQARPLSPALAAGRYRQLRFAPDGRRVVLVRGDNELVEVDAVTGAILRTAAPEPADALYSPTYTDTDLVVLRAHWEGNIWVADAAFGASAPLPVPGRR